MALWWESDLKDTFLSERRSSFSFSLFGWTTTAGPVILTSLTDWLTDEVRLSQVLAFPHWLLLIQNEMVQTMKPFPNSLHTEWNISAISHTDVSHILGFYTVFREWVTVQGMCTQRQDKLLPPNTSTVLQSSWIDRKHIFCEHNITGGLWFPPEMTVHVSQKDQQKHLSGGGLYSHTLNITHDIHHGLPEQYTHLF